jgi:hypothetical protein
MTEQRARLLVAMYYTEKLAVQITVKNSGDSADTGSRYHTAMHVGVSRALSANFNQGQTEFISTIGKHLLEGLLDDTVRPGEDAYRTQRIASGMNATNRALLDPDTAWLCKSVLRKGCSSAETLHFFTAAAAKAGKLGFTVGASQLNRLYGAQLSAYVRGAALEHPAR